MNKGALFLISGGFFLAAAALATRIFDPHNATIPDDTTPNPLSPELFEPPVTPKAYSFPPLFSGLFSFTGDKQVPGQLNAPIILADVPRYDRPKLSSAKLSGVDPELIEVMELANQISPLSFKITEGLRSTERQKELYAQGATKTLNSKHLEGLAVDIFVNPPKGEEPWKFEHFQIVSKYVKMAANALGVKVIWGGDWKTFKDGPHFELIKGEFV